MSASINVSNPDLVEAVHQVTGERAAVPEHWLGKDSPFPGQWGKTAPSPAKSREVAKALAEQQKEG